LRDWGAAKAPRGGCELRNVLACASVMTNMPVRAVAIALFEVA
jgi:hypothetical protein